jgi:hypothetical protein
MNINMIYKDIFKNKEIILLPFNISEFMNDKYKYIEIFIFKDKLDNNKKRYYIATCLDREWTLDPDENWRSFTYSHIFNKIQPIRALLTSYVNNYGDYIKKIKLK